MECVISALKCWGGLCDIDRIPHFPPTELAVLWRSSFFPVGRTFCLYPSRPVQGYQLNDWAATSCFTERVMAVAEGPFKSKDGRLATRPPASREKFRRLVRTCSLQGEFSFLAVVSWIFFLLAKSEEIAMRRRESAWSGSGGRQANSLSLLGLVGGHLVPKLRRRKRLASGVILTRPCSREGRDPYCEDLHIPQLLRPACSV